MAFRVTDLEKDIAPLSGFDGYERSSWLSFVLPLAADQAHHIGAVTIPIPLRAYPLPPSLIRHQGEADPDSVAALDAVRRWQYRYVYEHLDVAQDVINTDITFNAVSQIAPPATSAGTGPRSLFEALANFVTLYPAIAADLDALTADGGDPTNAVVAIAAFAQLVGEVSAALSPRGGRSLGRGVVESVRYAISERRDEDDTLHVTITTVNDGLTPPPAGTRTPQIEITGYTQSGPPVVDGDETRYILVPEAGTAPQEANTVTGLGNSSLPDRALIVPDLDVIQQQLATASIWLTRNRELVDGRVTNPSFVYKTPLIRFRNSTSPLVQNRTPWDIAAIGSPTGAAQRRPLAAHVDALFAALLPAVAQNDYAIRIAVRYRFNLAEAGAQPLFSSLPVLLGPRYPIDAGADLLPATADLRANLVRTLERWQQTMQPSTAQAAYQFRVAIFSRLRAGTAANNLPLLQIEELFLGLGDVGA
ncbi:MAG: hypothetical protein R2873_35260 [Caldilineaceae bacterium]